MIIKIAQINEILMFQSSKSIIILLINVKMVTIVGILTLMSRIDFMHSRVEHERSFITSGPGAASRPLGMQATQARLTSRSGKFFCEYFVMKTFIQPTDSRRAVVS